MVFIDRIRGKKKKWTSHKCKTGRVKWIKIDKEEKKEDTVKGNCVTDIK